MLFFFSGGGGGSYTESCMDYTCSLFLLDSSFINVIGSVVIDCDTESCMDDNYSLFLKRIRYFLYKNLFFH